MILLISASQVSRIIGVSHQCRLFLFLMVLEFELRMGLLSKVLYPPEPHLQPLFSMSLLVDLVCQTKVIALSCG
jgi:hypothetical protein